MRGIQVDERDSAWERHDPRFRVYVFEGPGNAVTTVDIVDATVEEALEAARSLANDDAHLWSLALVDDDSRGMRGLVWLSGTDYNDVPRTPRDVRLRGRMQDRYLAARALRGLDPVLPDGLRVIRVFPEWTDGWPLWESFTPQYRRTGPELGLSPALSDALRAWNDRWQDRREDEPEPEGWAADGEALVSELRRELAGIAEVRAEFLD